MVRLFIIYLKQSEAREKIQSFIKFLDILIKGLLYCSLKLFNMVKKGKDKKKGKGAEKTLAKTEKKLSNKMKKELQAKGEDDIENIIAQIEKEEKKRQQVTEVLVEPPSRRLNFSFVSHPDKDQLILYGGEFFNGQKTLVYNDLYFYNIPNNTWTLIKAPAGPPPRCGHQMVAVSSNKGQLWVFGGEYASPTQSQFYHYRDLWVYHIAKKQWEKITAPDGPSARSGHRMVLNKKQLIVFGGFHDNLRDYKYFNDVYSFNLETYKWSKIEPVGTPPAPRSGCCMVTLNDGRILIYGGYSKEKVKKDVDKGHVYTDAFVLAPDKHDETSTKFRWMQVKISGIKSSPRCSMPIVANPNNLFAYCYGGVYDTEEDEESISSTFYDEFQQLDLEKLTWKQVVPSGRKDKDSKGRRRKAKEEGDNESQDSEEEQEMEVEELKEKVETTTISDDGVFKVTVGPAPSASNENSSIETQKAKLFQPSARMNSGLAIKHGILYLYGGMFEDGDKQLTFSDLYSMDLKKLDEWKTIIKDDTSQMEWVGSDSESEDDGSDESGSEEDGSEDEESDMDTE